MSFFLDWLNELPQHIPKSAKSSSSSKLPEVVERAVWFASEKPEQSFSIAIQTVTKS